MKKKTDSINRLTRQKKSLRTNTLRPKIVTGIRAGFSLTLDDIIKDKQEKLGCCDGGIF